MTFATIRLFLMCMWRLPQRHAAAKLAFLLTLIPALLQATPGALDLSFKLGVDETVNAMAEQADGKIIIGGSFTHVFGSPRQYLARLNEDGTVDSTFNVSANGTVHAIIIQADGSFFIGGAFTEVNGEGRKFVAKINREQGLDGVYQPALNFSAAYDEARSLALQPDGRLIVGMSYRGIYLLSTNGTVLTGFTAPINGIPHSLCVQSNGGIIVGGSFSSLDSYPRSNLGRLNSSGYIDLAWSATANQTVYCLSENPDGSITVGGEFSTLGSQNRSYIGRVSATGGVDSIFKPTLSVPVRSTFVFSDGRVLASFLTGTSSILFSSTGAVLPWSPEISNTYTGQSFMMQRSGKLLIGAAAQTDSQGLRQKTLQSIFGGSQKPSLSLSEPGTATWTPGDMNAAVSQLHIEYSIDTGLSWNFGGTMTRLAHNWEAPISGIPAGSIIRARGRVFSGLGNASSYYFTTYAETTGSAPEIHVRLEDGTALTDGVGTLTFTTPGQKRRLIIQNTGDDLLHLERYQISNSMLDSFKVDTSAFTNPLTPGDLAFADVTYDPPIQMGGPITGTLKLPSNDVDEPLFTIHLNGAVTPSSRTGIGNIMFSGKVYSYKVNGGFSPYVQDYVIQIPANLFYAYIAISADEAGSSALGVTINGVPAQISSNAYTLSSAATQVLNIVILALDGVTTKTYRFTLNRLPALPGEIALEAVLPVPDKAVYSVAEQTDGSLILGGAFTSLSGTPRIGMARLSATGNLDPTYDPQAEYTYCLRSLMDGTLRIGGSFRTVHGSPQLYLAQLSSTGQGLSHFRSPYARLGEGVLTMLEDENGFLAGGRFLYLSNNVQHLTRFHSDGTWDGSYYAPPAEYSSVYRAAAKCLTRLPDGTTLSCEEVGIIRRDNFGRRLPWATVEVSGAKAILAQADGKYLIAGGFSTVNGTQRINLARLDASGVLDPTFNPLLFANFLDSVALQADGKIIVGGMSGTSGGVYIARLNPDGTLDSTFNNSWNEWGMDPLEGPANLFHEINSLTLRKNGRVLAAGEFTQFRGVPKSHLVELFNQPATETLTVVSPEHVIWQRSGSSPETPQTWFSVSKDGGASWQELGAGRRIPGGWEITDLSLPASGRLRARALIPCGMNDASTGLIESTKDFSFPPAQATLLNSTGQPVPAGTVLDFGSVGTTLGAKVEQSFSLRNDGGIPLENILITLSGAAQADFQLLQALPSRLLPGASITFHLRFMPKSLGIRQASLTLGSSDPAAPAYMLNLTGLGVAAKSYSIQTGLLTALSLDSATVTGKIQPADATRSVFIDYGTSPTLLGQTVAASPGSVSGTAEVILQQNLTGLTPGTLYHYRFRAESTLGNVQGATKTFRTPTVNQPQEASVFGPTTVPAEGGSLTMQVTADSAWWSLGDLPTWCTASAKAGYGSSDVTLTFGPNSLKTQRQAVISIAGSQITFTQQVVTAVPQISGLPVGTITARVNQPWQLKLTLSNQPATLTATGLPSGLRATPDGWITGTFTRAGSYTTTLTARNALGPNSVVAKLSFQISALSGVPGIYQGLIPRDTTLNQNLASRFECVVTSTGSYTGKVITGITAAPFKGSLQVYQDSETFTTLVSPPKAPALRLSGSIYHKQKVIRANLSTLEGNVQRDFSAWQAAPMGMVMPFNIAITQPNMAVDLPNGHGYASFTPSAKDGSFRLSGRLADGTALSFSGNVGTGGDTLIYQPLYGNRGSLVGVLNFYFYKHTGTLTWLKPPPASPTAKDPIYRAGFGPIELQTSGGRYPGITPGGVAPGASATLRFSYWEPGTTETTLSVPLQIINPSSTGRSNRAQFTPSTNPLNATLPTLNPMTGAFSGTVTLPATAPALGRKVTFQGLLISPETSISGHGWFLLPQSTAAGSLQTSGRVDFFSP